MVVGEGHGEGTSGLGLHAAQDIKNGQVLFQEQPLAFIQSQWNARVAATCLSCGQALGGDLRQCLATVLDGVGQADPGLEAYPHLRQEADTLYAPHLMLPTAHLCPKHCCSTNDPTGCRAAFCSSRCQDAQLLAGHHRILCLDLPTEHRSAWQAFQEHSTRYCETFILAAEVIAQIVAEVVHGGATLEESTARYAHFIGKPWPDIVTSKNAVLQESWKKRRWEVLLESHALLETVLSSSVTESLKYLCTVDFYACMVGMLDLVSKDLERPNPLDGMLRAQAMPVRALTDLRKISVLWARARLADQEQQSPTSPESSEDTGDASEEEVAGEVPAQEQSQRDPGCVNLVQVADRLSTLPVLPGFAGFGLVASVALMNHSCDENVSVNVNKDTLLVTGKAIRDIGKGEELFMAYVDTTKKRAWRQRYLQKSYGFLCHCSRCSREATRSICDTAQREQ